MSSINKSSELIPMFDITAVINKLDARYAVTDRNKPEVTLARKPSVTSGTESKHAHALVTKHYSAGVMKELETREAKLLLDLMSAKVNINGQDVLVRSRVTHLRALDQTQSLALQIEMPWHGFDLDDWVKLLGKGDQSLVRNPTFLLALMRSALKALHQLHSLGWVHCDVKRDNWCLPWVAGSLPAPGQPLVGKLNPNDLRLIDLGIALRESQHRTEKLVLGTKMAGIAPYQQVVRQAHEQALNNDFEPIKKLDWRCDLQALGYMFESWDKSEALSDEAALVVNFRNLCYHLKKTDLQGNTPALPHESFISQINQLIGKADKDWDFAIDGALMPGQAPQAQPDIKPDTENKAATSSGVGLFKQFTQPDAPVSMGTALLTALKVWVVGVLVVAAGIYGINAIEKFARPQLLPPAPALAEQSPRPVIPAAMYSAGAQRIFENGEKLVDGLRPSGSQLIKLQTSQPSYRIGQPMSFTITAPSGGYLSLLFQDAGDKWPHVQVATTNVPVQAGQTLTLPDPLFPLLAAPPAGQMRITAVVTQQPFDWAASFAKESFDSQAIAGAVASPSNIVQVKP